MQYGPIGREVKLKNGKWGKMVESFFGDTLNGFVVTNSDDRRTLNNIIRRCRARHPVYMMDTSGDFNLDTPDPSRFTTILDLLTFDSEAVRRMLINIAHIETTIVVEHRPDGDEIMKWNKPVETNITACISQDAYRLGGLCVED
jgi:chromosome segregation ATPase